MLSVALTIRHKDNAHIHVPVSKSLMGVGALSVWCSVKVV